MNPQRFARITRKQFFVVRIRGHALETGDVIDPTTDEASMAFVPRGSGNPTDADWKTATWGNSANGWYALACLIGADTSVPLVAGMYDVWIRVVDEPETPIVLAGALEVY